MRTRVNIKYDWFIVARQSGWEASDNQDGNLGSRQ